MQSKFSKLFLLLVPFALAAFVCSCDKNEDEPTPSSSMPEIELPARYEIYKGEPREITLNVKSGKAETTDIVSLQLNGGGTLTPCQVSNVSETTVTFPFPEKLADGKYQVIYRRDTNSRNLGSMEIAVIDKPFDLADGTTIYGTVSTPDGPLEGVLISDGFEFAKTDAEGHYQLASNKTLPYVFMVTPSGYEPDRKGVFPTIYQPLHLQGDKTPEQCNFSLTKVDQSKFTVLFMGDMHLAKRTNDMNQFKDFTNEINEYVSTHRGEKVYGITLGDMSWDLYWYSNSYNLENYAQTINSYVEDLMIYHIIGNHDNDMRAVASNYDAKILFRTAIAPNYYSFNIGETHFIVLDNIDCTNYDGSNRDYTEQVVSEQMQWLRKDLSYVDKSTPIVMMLHAPVYGTNSATQFKLHMKNASELVNALDGYKVDFVTGHTHKNYNVAPSHTCVGGKDIREHNQGAVCGDWWWSGHLSSGFLMAPDGTPAGYSIWNFDGKDVKWIYKGTGRDINYQFRCYDLNKVKFSDDDVPNLKTDTKAYKDFAKYKNAYPGRQNDEVLINIWNYNPSWKVTVVTEDGRTLTAKPAMAYDPLHIKAMTVKRYNSSSISSSPNFITQNYPHFFRFSVPNSELDLTITVEDEFGHVWTETMVRPMEFNLEAYK